MNNESHLQATADEIIAATLQRINCIEPQLRRFSRSASDLGLPVPVDWVEVHPDGTVTFAPLTAAQFNRLVCLLEDIADDRPVNVTVVQGGASLFDVGAPQGPTPSHVASSVHMVVPK